MKLTKTQIKCIEKSILFEIACKETLQKNIDAYKCLRGFKVTYATKKRVIMVKHAGGGTYRKVDIKIVNTGCVFKP